VPFWNENTVMLKYAGYTDSYTAITDYLREVQKHQREAFLPLEPELGTYTEVD